MTLWDPEDDSTEQTNKSSQRHRESPQELDQETETLPTPSEGKDG